MSALGGERAGGLRLIRIVLVAEVVGIVILTFAVVGLFLLNADRVEQINRERAATIRRSCEDLNTRNRASLTQLDRVLVARTNGNSQDQSRWSRADTKALIDALVPRRDCDRVVREQVNIP